MAPLPAPQPSSCTTFMLDPHLGRAATSKKSLAAVHKGSLRLCPTLCDPAHCGLPGFSIRGTLQARILEHFGHYWLPYPSRALYFLLPQLPTPLSIWCCQNPCNPTSCTASAISPLWDRSKSSRAAAQANPSGRPRGRYRGGNKITV